MTIELDESAIRDHVHWGRLQKAVVRGVRSWSPEMLRRFRDDMAFQGFMQNCFADAHARATMEVDRNGNRNAMMGRECPDCGEHVSLLVSVRTVASLGDDGTDANTSDHEWPVEGCDHMWCNNCGFEGKCEDFEMHDPAGRNEDPDE